MASPQYTINQDWYDDPVMDEDPGPDTPGPIFSEPAPPPLKKPAPEPMDLTSKRRIALNE